MCLIYDGSTDQQYSEEFPFMHQNPVCSSLRTPPWQDGEPVGRTINTPDNGLLTSSFNISTGWSCKLSDEPFFRGTSMAQSNSQSVLRQHYSISIHSQTRWNPLLIHLLDQFVILLVPTHLPGARNVTTDALSHRNSPSPTEWCPEKEGPWVNLSVGRQQNSALFLLYSGIVALKGKLEEVLFGHFITFHVAITMLSSKELSSQGEFRNYSSNREASEIVCWVFREVIWAWNDGLQCS